MDDIINIVGGIRQVINIVKWFFKKWCFCKILHEIIM